MSSDENKSVVRRWIDEVLNQQHIGSIDELFAPTYVNHLAPAGFPTGPAGERQFTQLFFDAFPDGQMTIEDMLAEGDCVAWRYIYGATHQGNFQGIPATGKRFSVCGINIVRLTGGKIVENWPSIDMLGIMQQIGVIPAPGR